MYSGESFEEDDDAPYDDGPVTLEPCGNCGRKFNQDSLMRHEKICNSTKKRKVFNSSKQRTEGLEKVKTQTPSVQKTPKKKADWRRQHEEFVKTIRAARGVTNALKTGGELPPPPEPTINPDYIQCPHCERRFNESAAERHMNFCKEQKTRLPKASSDSKFSQKSEKQKIRTQYRPPLPGQKKSSTGSPVKPRGSSSSHTGSPANRKEESSPGLRQKPIKKKPDEKPIPKTNGRYNFKDHADSPSSPSERTKSGKSKESNPEWYSDLKRGSSGKTSSARSQHRHNNDHNSDSGVDLNDGGNHRKPARHRAAPQEEEDLFNQRNVRNPSAGRRQKMANFCHDCGTKYPVDNAKFCCECGVRRMAMT